MASSTSTATIPTPHPDGPIPLDYDEVIHTRGIDIPFVPAIITPKIERPMRNNRYEGGECALLGEILRPDDRVLDLGAGVGLVSSIAARAVPRGRVTAVEANPDMIPLIRETYRLNGIRNVDLKNAIATSMATDGSAKFYLRADFWASSMEPNSRPYVRVEEVAVLDVRRLIADVDPTVICCDIEGGEFGLFDDVDLSGVRQVIMELHPKVYGQMGVESVHAALKSQGLQPVPQKKESTVMVFARGAAAEDAKPAVARTEPPKARRWATTPHPAAPVAHGDADAETGAWPPTDPRILLATCMKDEGPFILEWVAWHKAIGVTDIVVFTNHCSDGTDLLLDRLDEMGELTHLPNPALATDSTSFQPAALNYIENFRAFRDADFFISSDVDEFFNIRVGQGTFNDLFAAVPQFDVLSVNEINHGCNHHEHFEPGWVTEQFPAHSTEAPGKWRAHVGVKSIVRKSPALQRVRNHRPDLKPDAKDPVWLDGAGQPIADFMEDASKNGTDCRGRYQLVSLDHFPLRSLDSYLIKMFRGDVVVKGKQVGQRYWRQRNRHEANSSDLAPGIAAARAYHAKYDLDEPLMDLHRACCDQHQARIDALLHEPQFKERREWALAEAWD